MPKPQIKLILASTSPRRKEILSLLKIPFQTCAPDFEEVTDHTRTAKEEALDFAKGKALSVAKDYKRHIIIGSDTLIECDGEKIGKPKDPKDASAILKKLQGRSHYIWTGVFLIDTSSQTTEGAVEKIEVTMFKMSDLEIDNYIQTKEPLDKAGAYAIQGEGWRFIRELKGDRLAAIGLPLRFIASFLSERQFTLPSDLPNTL